MVVVEKEESADVKEEKEWRLSRVLVATWRDAEAALWRDSAKAWCGGNAAVRRRQEERWRISEGGAGTALWGA